MIETNALLAGMLPFWFPDGVDAISDRLPGGDLNDVFRVEKDGQAYALRVYTHTATREAVSEEQEVVIRFAERLPEVYEPLATRSGELCVEFAGCVAALSRFAEGVHADRSAKSRKAAAGLLARVHQASVDLGLAVDRQMYPPLSALNWLSNRWWTWETMQEYIREATLDDACEIEPAWILDKLAISLDEITGSIQTLRQLDLPSLQVHGDFYPRNLKTRAGRIVALLDWDETRVDWRAWEIGRSIWEFCRTPQRGLDVTAARDFIAKYRRSGGAVLAIETEGFVPLMRADILWGVLYSFGEAQRSVDAERGLAVDWAYQAAQLSALEGLREVSLA